MPDGDSRHAQPSDIVARRLPGGRNALDAGQQSAAETLDAVFDELVNGHTPHTWFGRAQRPAVQGLYLWGGVGRGKTFLMDCFFEAIPFENKTRLHFYRFMQKVHAARSRHKHKRDPLRIIADEWAEDRVLCFDEFFVDDIADAMILSRLTERLFEKGVVLVATSNVAPDDLYQDGLKRDRFLPAIERIKHHCRIEHMPDGDDYRLAHIDHNDMYQTPTGEAADAVLAHYFERLASGESSASNHVKIEDRKIATVCHASGVVWCRFEVLCGGNRAAADYLALAREFATILISDVPILDDTRIDAARRFVSAIDTFYDRKTNVFISADAAPDDLYQGTRLTLEFERTASRLHEIQSTAHVGCLRT
ncbi:cell division protein ZapE [Salinisphaera sp. USBA-960]|uniref:cell division protein ZapE n=1 Tax=Salinisphaera orenii TaxID=856731 RepID=UPI000DBEAA07|nr:cell division protein ZapE [Salifodinibacter halophilus]NNC25786.1 cell division protein ZapE [Salifodinibacter halophilus]